MSDELVQRLRMSAETAPHWLRHTYTSAADEIERLRAEVAALREQYDGIEEERNAMDAVQDRAEAAESALAALRKRVEEAPEVIASSGQHMMPGYLIGKRVALVVLD